MLLSTLVGLCGGATMAAAAAFVPLEHPRVNSKHCSAGVETVTTTETVTATPEVVILSIDDVGAAWSSLMDLASNFPFSSFTPAFPTGDEDTTVTVFGTVTETLTLKSATTSAFSGYGRGSYFTASSGTTIKSSTPTVTAIRTIPSETTGTSVDAVSGVSSTISTTSTITNVDSTTVERTKTLTSTVHANSSTLTFPTTKCSLCESSTTSANQSSTADSIYPTATDDLITVTVTEASTTTTLVKPSQTTTTYLWANGTTINPVNGSATSTSHYVFPTPHSRSCTATTATGTLAASYASSASADRGGHYKRGVCDIVTATMDDGTTIVFPNAWDGKSYVPTCTMPSSLSSSGDVPPVTVTVTPSTSQVVVPTFPSSNVVRSSSALSTTWNATVTSVPTTALSTFATLTTRPAPSPTPDCGELGTFQITFEDLPVNSASDPDTAPFPPIFPPYRHFDWSLGWTYVPPPTSPFVPQNGDRLGMYVPPSENDTTVISSYTSIHGGFFGGGAVAPLSSSTYWFDAKAAYLGCDNGPWNNATEDCIVTARGYHYNSVTTLQEVADYSWSIPPCKTMRNCTVSPIIFDSQFESLSTLSFEAKVGAKQVFLYMDSFVGFWANNTCTSGQERGKTR